MARDRRQVVRVFDENGIVARINLTQCGDGVELAVSLVEPIDRFALCHSLLVAAVAVLAPGTHDEHQAVMKAVAFMAGRVGQGRDTENSPSDDEEFPF